MKRGEFSCPSVNRGGTVEDMRVGAFLEEILEDLEVPSSGGKVNCRLAITFLEGIENLFDRELLMSVVKASFASLEKELPKLGKGQFGNAFEVVDNELFFFGKGC